MSTPPLQQSATQPTVQTANTAVQPPPGAQEVASKANKIRSVAFWIVVVVLVVLWLAAWFIYKCGPWIHLLPVLALAATLVELLSRSRESKNIDPQDKGIPNWDPARPEESLAEIHLYVIREAANSTNWYLKNKGSKAFWSRIIRLSVWGLAAVGGLLPVMSEVLKDYFHNLDLTKSSHLDLTNGLWASLLLGIAAALLGLDKGFGFSSGWARYVLTATNIRKSMEEFRLDWTTLRAKAGTPLTTYDQVAPLIERAKQFRSEVESLVLQETKDWVTEFQSTMAQMEKDVAAQLSALKTQVDKTIQAREEASKGGAIHVNIQNVPTVVPGSLRVVVVDSSSKTVLDEELTSSTWTSRFLPPGMYQVKLEIALSSPPMGNPPTPQMVTVKTGEFATVDFSL
jgi:hypothetical protein